MRFIFIILILITSPVQAVEKISVYITANNIYLNDKKVGVIDIRELSDKYMKDPKLTMKLESKFNNESEQFTFMQAKFLNDQDELITDFTINYAEDARIVFCFSQLC